MTPRPQGPEGGFPYEILMAICARTSRIDQDAGKEITVVAAVGCTGVASRMPSIQSEDVHEHRREEDSFGGPLQEKSP